MSAARPAPRSRPRRPPRRTDPAYPFPGHNPMPIHDRAPDVDPPCAGDVRDVAACVALARDGDTLAFGELVRAHRDRLYRFALRITRNPHDAEDVCQRTFISAWRHLARFDSSRPFANWLFGIAYKDAVKLVTRRRPSGELPEIACERPSPDMAADAAETPMWDLARATLDPARFDILWMFYGEDLPVAEIARITGRTCVSVKVHLFRARSQLRARLDKPRAVSTVSPATSPLP